MEKLSKERLQYFANRLEADTQENVMKAIGQFSEAEISEQDVTKTNGPALHAMVFNMERGEHLDEILEFLRDCPDIQPFDLILANELDDGCARSGNRNVAKEIAQALGMHYVFGLEFIELTDESVGFHGNAIFSRWPIVSAEVLRLPEEYNWYFDRQKRIGGRCAVLAKLDVAGQEVGVASIHLENRTSGEGRARQMQAVLNAATRLFPGIPMVLGGDLNTNTFDGRDTQAIGRLAKSVSALPCAQEVERLEPLLSACRADGYTWQVPNTCQGITRRKPLPDGGHLALQLDWILARGRTPSNTRIVSTLTKDLQFARAGGALSRFEAPEISDHNVVCATLD